MSSYLTTLRRIPDDIVLSMATRDIVPCANDSCICGWAIREVLARATNVDAGNVSVGYTVRSECERLFGGDWDEWDAIYSGIMECDSAPHIERAFVTRVMEAAGVAP